MDIQQDVVQEAIAEAGVIPPGQNPIQNQGQVQGNVQYITLDNISAIVKDAVGGVKDYIDNALSSTKSQVNCSTYRTLWHSYPPKFHPPISNFHKSAKSFCYLPTT